MKVRHLKRRVRNRFLKLYRARRGCWGEHNHWGEKRWGEHPGLLVEAGTGRLAMHSSRALGARP